MSFTSKVASFRVAHRVFQSYVIRAINTVLLVNKTCEMYSTHAGIVSEGHVYISNTLYLLVHTLIASVVLYCSCLHLGQSLA